MSRFLATSRRRKKRLLGPPGPLKALRKAMALTLTKAAVAPLKIMKANLAKQRKAQKRAVKLSVGAALKPVRAGQALLRAALPQTGRGKVAPSVPDGAQYLTRRYRCPAGARGYKLYLPASQPERPCGLIVMLHGCLQSPDDFAVGTHMNQLAEKHGLAIAYPAQTRQNNARSCWNWFRPQDQARGSGEPAVLAALTRKLMKELGVDRDRTFVAGLSAGGAMAAILVDEYPDIFAAGGIHSGLARGAADSVVSAMTTMRDGSTARNAPVVAPVSDPVRRIVFQGDRDSTVHPSNAANIVTAALGVGATPSQIVTRSVRGRGYVRSTYPASSGSGVLELWIVNGAGHAWSGGRKAGSFTDSAGPDASAQMVRFFLAKPAWA